MDERIHQFIMTHIEGFSSLYARLNQFSENHKRNTTLGRAATKSIFSGLAKMSGIPVRAATSVAGALKTTEFEEIPEFSMFRSEFQQRIESVKSFLGTVSIATKTGYEPGESYRRKLEVQIAAKPLKKQILSAMSFLRQLSTKKLVYPQNIIQESKPKYAYQFDTQIFDRILSGEIDVKLLESAKMKGCAYFVTHVQIDEINRCEDVDKRARLFLLMQDIGATLVSTESFVPGISRFNFARMSDDGLLQQLKGANPRHSEDALIGEAAMKANVTLVCDDRRLRKKVNELKGRSLTPKQFLEEIGKF